MDTPLILILILAFAFAMTHLEALLVGDRVQLFGGLEYLLIGVICGPQVLDILTRASLVDLEPLLAVVTGFIGFLYGLPVARSARPVTGARRFGAIVALVTAALVGAGAYWVLGLFDVLAGASPTERFVAAAVLGFGAAACSVEAIVSSVISTRSRGPISALMPRVAATTRVFAILGFGTVLALDSQNHFATSLGIPAELWLLVELSVGVGLGIVFRFFVGDEQDTHRLFVATIGVVILASGVAYALELSPLFVNLVLGITVANTCSAAPRLTGAVERLGRPLTAVLLLIAGAVWMPIPGEVWIIPAAFIVWRIVVLHFGTWLGSRRHPSIDPHTPLLGNALLAQGALATAIAVNYHMVPVHSLEAVVVTSLILSSVINELYASWALRRVLQRAGETGRRPRDAEGAAAPAAAPVAPAPGGPAA